MNKSTKPQKKDYRFCSQCKHSEYVRPYYYNGNLMLRCEVYCQHYEPNAEIDHCKAFDPERKEDAPLRDRAAWVILCKKCGIGIKEIEMHWPQ